MTYEKTLALDSSYLDEIKKYLTIEPTSASDCLGEDETISETVAFDNGFEMDVKCCGVQFKDGESNLAWTEAVLFCNGSEVCCTEPCDVFESDWKLDDDDGNTYIVHVVGGEQNEGE